MDIEAKKVLVNRSSYRLDMIFQSRCRPSEVIGVDCRAFEACSLAVPVVSREGNGAAAQITASSTNAACKRKLISSYKELRKTSTRYLPIIGHSGKAAHGREAARGAQEDRPAY